MENGTYYEGDFKNDKLEGKVRYIKFYPGEI
jgi:hypothetical protein